MPVTFDEVTATVAPPREAPQAAPAAPHARPASADDPTFLRAHADASRRLSRRDARLRAT